MAIRLQVFVALVIGVVVGAGTRAGAADAPTTRRVHDRTEDVHYGRSFGTALTMDVFRPVSGGNGRGVIVVVSGGWVSDKTMISPGFEHWFVQTLTARGYTVFAVLHGSQPKYTIPEIVPMVRRAVRFVRYHSKEYGIDPDRLGICGGSAGGHLSLMVGSEPEVGSAAAPDPVDREPCRVAAVGVFFPPTDFLNYGEPGVVMMGTGKLQGFRAPFDFREPSKQTHALERVTEARALEIGRDISPIYHVSDQTAPTLIFHGDADPLVPVQQARIYIEKMKSVGATGELVEKPGQGHGWGDVQGDMTRIADWFDRWLGAAPTPRPTTAASES
jgi:acetyl esterase/lipase